ncbi:MAG TPA: hypothetical protein VMH91_02415 [Candidatus Paceibacterota bacterium]|nr:hypothetical protein [Candidatus Paceibacterota bacterium]
MTKRTFHISRLKPSVFQGAFDFEAVSKRQTPVLAIEHPAERIMFTVLLVVLGLFICAYFYLVVASVLNVIARKQADATSADLQQSIGSLEQQYFALSQSITPQEASQMGLAPIQQTQYVYRPGNAAAAVASAARAI